MADGSTELTFDDYRTRIETADDTTRVAWIHRFVGSYLSPDNDTFRRVARREFFDQLRPLYTVEDIVSRVCEKLERRLRSGKLHLTSEKKFLSYVTRAIQLALLDVNRLQRLPATPLESAGTASRADDNLVDPHTGPQTQFLNREGQEKLCQMLREMLQPDEWYLIRRHYFEGASYAEIAAEVLPPENGPLGPVQLKNRSDRIRMRLQRIREEIAAREEDFLLFLDE